MTPDEYIDGAPEPKRSELRRLHELITKTLPAFEPHVAGTMIGYGRYHYRYESGREGDASRVALANNKTGISVYVSAVDEGGWLAEQAREDLGKADVGKSCIRFKRLADVEMPALAALLRKAGKTQAPGEVSGPSGKPPASPARKAKKTASPSAPARKARKPAAR